VLSTSDTVATGGDDAAAASAEPSQACLTSTEVSLAVAFKDLGKGSAGTGTKVGGQDEDVEDGEVAEVPLPAAVEALLEGSGDLLDVVALHALAARQISAKEAASAELDVLTGCHFTDGQIRIMFIEGPESGAMASLIAPVRVAPLRLANTILLCDSAPSTSLTLSV
jgi:hypothetical protein